MKYENGFTLIELMITLLVVGVLLVIATPGFKTFIEDNRISTSSNDFLNAIAVARSEAIRRRGPVTLCSSSDFTSCANNTSWQAGWIIFNDRNSNGIFDGTLTDPDEVILRVWEALPGSITLTPAGGTTNVQFDRLGAASVTDTFRLSNPFCKTGQANRERDILLVGSGIASVTRKNCP